MSKVKIEGNASGTGTFTITSPNSSTDRTITLPDATGDLVSADASGNVSVISELLLGVVKVNVPVPLALPSIFTLLIYTIVHVEPLGTVTVTPEFMVIAPAVIAFLLVVIV